MPGDESDRFIVRFIVASTLGLIALGMAMFVSFSEVNRPTIGLGILVCYAIWLIHYLSKAE